MGTFIEQTDIKFRQQINTTADKIDEYGDKFELTSAEVTTLKEDAKAFRVIFAFQLAIQTFAQNFTKFKNQLRYGGENPLGTLPPIPAYAATPIIIVQGIEKRYRDLVQKIIHHSAYNPNDGEDLGFVAPEVIFNPSTGKPTFHIVKGTGGHPRLRWKKGKFEGVEIWKNTGSGFVKLDRDMRPDYIDKSDLPPVGVSATWKYRMIYIYKDEVVGQWSDEVAVSVLGIEE